MRQGEGLRQAPGTGRLCLRKPRAVTERKRKVPSCVRRAATTCLRGMRGQRQLPVKREHPGIGWRQGWLMRVPPLHKHDLIQGKRW